jgi:alpha-ketoglutarate-dependent taurine dioxygenase
MEFYKEIECNKLLGKTIKEMLSHYKVIVARQASSDEGFWIDQVSDVGELVPMKEDPSTGNKTGDFWIDIKYDLKFPNTFLHSNTRQPLHTDGSYEAVSPNITFFFCVEPAVVGGDTTCIEIDVIKNCLKIENPDLLDKATSQELIFSKGNDFKKSKIINGEKGNWNYFRAEKCKLVEDFHNYLETRILQMGILKGFKLFKGDAIFFNDELIFHGRNAFIGNRWLKKGGVLWRG